MVELVLTSYASSSATASASTPTQRESISASLVPSSSSESSMPDSSRFKIVRISAVPIGRDWDLFRSTLGAEDKR